MNANSQPVHDLLARLAWFKSIILPHESALRRQVHRLAGPDVDVDDVVSEALARAYSASDWSRIDRGRGYLFTIARNLLFDAARRRSIVSFHRMADLDTLHLADDAPSTEAIVCAQDELRRLQEIVDELPLQCRRVFLLRRVHERSLQEIAVELGLSVSTVEKHLAKAMESLTQALAESDPATSGSTSTWRGAKHRR